MLTSKAMAVNSFLQKIVLFEIVGGVLVGYFIGSLNGIIEMDGFKSTFSELYSYGQLSGNSTFSDGQVCSSGNGASSDMLIGLIVSIGNFKAAIGGLLSGWLADKLSRKYTLLIGGLLAVLGSTISAVSFHTWTLILGRGFGGISMGMIYMVIPVYISEIAPKESRGLISGLLGTALSFGIFFSMCANIGFSKFYFGWRISFIVMTIIGLMFIIGTKWMPYSPRWLVKKQHDNEALLVLSKIYHHSQKETFVKAIFELEELRSSINGDLNMSTQFKELLKYKNRLLIMLVLFFIEAMVGSNIVYFSGTIFCEVGVEPFIAIAIVVGLTLIGAFIASYLIDKIGRKVVVLACTFINIFLGATIALLSQMFESPSEVVSYSTVVMICVYVFFYIPGWSLIPWVLNGEIFPTNVRGITVAISTASFYLFAFIIAQITPLILGFLHIQGLFYIITGLNIFAFIFVLFVLPETAGVSLEQMDVLFSQSWLERANLLKFFKHKFASSLTEDPKALEVQHKNQIYADIKVCDKSDNV